MWSLIFKILIAVYASSAQADYAFNNANGAVGNLSYYCIASSDSGQYLAAGTIPGCMYTSADFGANWKCNEQGGNREWLQVASSGDGRRLAAIVGGAWGPTLSSDYGARWSISVILIPSQRETLYWYGIATSKSGDRIFVTMQVFNLDTNARDNAMYLSADYGNTWSRCDVILPSGVANWSPGSIASDFEGQRIVAAAQNSFLYMSSDFGTSWKVLPNSVPNCLPTCLYFWTSIAASNDGRVWAAAVNNGPIVISVDYGDTWNWNNNAGRRLWASITSSADGKYMAASGFDTNAWFSSDYGSTWSVPSSTLSRSGLQVELASSASGSRVAAATFPLGFFSTMDYGQSWTSAAQNTGVNQWQQVARAKNSTSVIAASQYMLYFSATASQWVAASGVPMSTGTDGVAISDDGRFSVATGTDGYIYSSSDFGLSWVKQIQSAVGSTVFRWVALTSSSSGRIIAAMKRDFNIYLSYDFGVQWRIQSLVAAAFQTNNNGDGDVACSSDGRYIYASFGINVLESFLYVSTDTGNTWSNISTPGFFSYIACSSDGGILVASSTNSAFVSRDYGQTWVRGLSRQKQYEFPVFLDVATSSSGGKLFLTSVYYVLVETTGVISSMSNQVHISEDLGITWNLIYSESIRTSCGSSNLDCSGDVWLSLSSSSDGLSLSLVPTLGYVTTAIYRPETNGNGGLSAGAIAGIAVGATAAVSISAAVVYTSVFTKTSVSMASTVQVSSSSVTMV